MKRKRRLLSALLIVAVLLAFVPMGAQATEEASVLTDAESNTNEDLSLDNIGDLDEKLNNVQEEENYNITPEQETDLETVAQEETVEEKEDIEKLEDAEEASGDIDKMTNNKDISEAKEVKEGPIITLRAGGNGDSKVVDVSITNFEIQNLSHETVTSVFYSDTFYLAMDWDASGHGTTIHEGDYFDITLPDNMIFPSGTTATNFNLTDENGDVVATAEVSPGSGNIGGTVHVTFTEAVEGKYNVKGTMFLAARFDRTQVTTGETNTFSITVNGNIGGPEVSTDVVIVGPKELDNEYLAKWGQSVANEPNMAEWWVRINHVKANLTNVILSDTMGNSGETYIRDSFQLRLVEYDSYGNTISSQAVDISDKLVISEDGKSFALNLGDINGEQYRLIYRTTYTPGTTLRNSFTLNSTEIEKTYSATHISANSGGTGGGDLASRIRLIKVDETDESIVLAGAVFEVTAPDGNTFELTTGADGTVTSGLLTQGSYKVKEISAPVGYELNEEEYTLNVSPSGGAVQTISNHPMTTEVSGSKIWNDSDNQDGIRPRNITIHLLADGEEIRSKSISAADNWSWTFADLPKYKNGEEINYTISEEYVDGYIPVYTGNNVTNLHSPSKTSVPVCKIWDDANDQDGIRPASITVKLLADNQETGLTEVLDASNDWTSAFEDLDEFKNGKKIEYTIEEIEISGYSSEITGDAENGYTITNTHQPEVIDINGSKTWDDANNQDGSRPESIIIRLFANGVEVDNKTVTETDDWSWNFEDWPKYEGGTEIVYSVTEDVVTDYSTSYYDYDITNTHQPGKTSITITKRWDDKNNQDGIRPNSITIKLLADGVDTGLALELSEADSWRNSFENLDVYNNGEKIEYTIKENEVSGYTISVSGDSETGYVITNVHDPEKPTTPSESDKPNKSEPTINKNSTVKPADKKTNATATLSKRTKSPKTGDEGYIPFYFSIAAAALVLLIVSILIRKKKEESEKW